MTVILKKGYSYKTYNSDDITYTQELTTPEGVCYKRSKGIYRNNREFTSTEEYFTSVCPEAFEATDRYEIINSKHPLYGDASAGDCWIEIFTGFKFRAFKKPA